MRDPGWVLPDADWFPAGVGIAATGEERAAIGRLRYEKYVQRDGKAYPQADHANRVLFDPIDARSVLFHARRGNGAPMATVRLSRLADALDDPQLGRLAALAEKLDITVANSRLVTEDDRDAKLAIKPMFQLVYEVGLLSGARYCLLSTRPALLKLFERFGFKQTGEQFRDAVAADQVVMRLDLWDVVNLATCRSPLLEVVMRRMGVVARTERVQQDQTEEA
jgi:predicted GNAT family N-acyltransferase